MDKTRYSKTRYQNIYKNIKNKNYIISISNPKTTISTFDGKKIYDIKNAIKIRDNYRTKLTKEQKSTNSETFKVLWDKYIYDCQINQKLAYNTIKKKIIICNCCHDFFDDKKINKITKEEIVLFLERIDKTDKQKNVVLKNLKAFFNWCCKNDYLIVSPAQYVTKYKVDKPKLNYWLPEHLKKFLNCLDDDIKNGNNYDILRAYTIKMFTLITFFLGDRTGETRALTFGNVNEDLSIINIEHSINYDPKSDSFFSHTKTPQSQRTIKVSKKLIDEIKNWKKFLKERCLINVTDDMPIIMNIETNRPLSDTALRDKFYYYIEKAKVPKIRMYDLRHTFVTTMMSEGWDMYAISEKVGHKRITTTINTYGNITQKVKNDMAETMDKYF